MNEHPCADCVSLEGQSADVEPHAKLTSGPTAAVWGEQNLEPVGKWWKCSACGTILLRNIDSRMGERLWHYSDRRFEP